MNSSDLVGRQIYFKLSKKAFKESDILDLTPGKLYTIIDPDIDSNLIHILDDIGTDIGCLVGKKTCAHLFNLTRWLLKRK